MRVLHPRSAPQGKTFFSRVISLLMASVMAFSVPPGCRKKVNYQPLPSVASAPKGGGDDSQTPGEKVNAEALMVFVQGISNYQAGDHFGTRMQVAHTPGPDYYKFFICSVDTPSNCSPSAKNPGEFVTPVGFYEAPPSGNVLVSIQACVRENRAANPNALCGPITTAPHKQTASNDPTVKGLLSGRRDISAHFMEECAKNYLGYRQFYDRVKDHSEFSQELIANLKSRVDLGQDLFCDMLLNGKFRQAEMDLLISQLTDEKQNKQVEAKVAKGWSKDSIAMMVLSAGIGGLAAAKAGYSLHQLNEIKAAKSLEAGKVHLGLVGGGNPTVTPSRNNSAAVWNNEWKGLGGMMSPWTGPIRPGLKSPDRYWFEGDKYNDSLSSLSSSSLSSFSSDSTLSTHSSWDSQCIYIIEEESTKTLADLERNLEALNKSEGLLREAQLSVQKMEDALNQKTDELRVRDETIGRQQWNLLYAENRLRFAEEEAQRLKTEVITANLERDNKLNLLEENAREMEALKAQLAVNANSAQQKSEFEARIAELEKWNNEWWARENEWKVYADTVEASLKEANDGKIKAIDELKKIKDLTESEIKRIKAENKANILVKFEEFNKLKDALNMSRNFLVERTAENTKLKDDLASLRLFNERLASEVVSLTNQVGGQSRHISGIESELVTKNAEIEALKAMNGTQVSRIDELTKSLESANAQPQSDSEQSKPRIAELEKSLASESERNVQLRGIINEKLAEKITLEHERNSLKEQLIALKTSSAAQSAELDRTKEDNRKKATDIETLTFENQKNKLELLQAQDAVKKSEAAAAEANRKLEELAANRTPTSGGDNKDLEAARAEVTRLQLEASNKNAALLELEVEKMDGEIELNKKIEELKLSFTEQLKEKDLALAKSAEDKAKVENDFAKIRNTAELNFQLQAQAHTIELDRANSKIQALQKDLQLLQAKNKSSDPMWIDMSNKLTELRVENKNLANKLSNTLAKNPKTSGTSPLPTTPQNKYSGLSAKDTSALEANLKNQAGFAGVIVAMAAVNTILIADNERNAQRLVGTVGSETSPLLTEVNRLAKESKDLVQKYEDASSEVDQKIRTRVMDADEKNIKKRLAALGL